MSRKTHEWTAGERGIVCDGPFAGVPVEVEVVLDRKMLAVKMLAEKGVIQQGSVIPLPARIVAPLAAASPAKPAPRPARLPVARPAARPEPEFVIQPQTWWETVKYVVLCTVSRKHADARRRRLRKILREREWYRYE